MLVEESVLSLQRNHTSVKQVLASALYHQVQTQPTHLSYSSVTPGPDSELKASVYMWTRLAKEIKLRVYTFGTDSPEVCVTSGPDTLRSNRY